LAKGEEQEFINGVISESSDPVRGSIPRLPDSGMRFHWREPPESRNDSEKWRG
jgi:hypothetical protein